MQAPRARPTDIPVFSRLNALQGAVNDARHIAGSLERLRANLTVLLDAAATKAAIIARWEEMIATAQKGDVVFFSISAHGGQEPARRPGATPTGLEETLILGGFDGRTAAGREERIFNDELGRLVRRVGPTGARVVYVADTCHAGGTVRQVDPRIAALAGYRGAIRYDVDADLSAAAPPDAGAQAPGADIAHLLFLAGAQANELVPEIRIGDRIHGALSHAVGLALSGLAAEQGVVTAGGLSRFVLRTVRTLSDSAQHPNVRWPNPDARGGVGLNPAEPLFRMDAPESPVPANPPAAPVGIAIWVLETGRDEAAALLAKVPGARLAASADAAALFYDPAGQRLLDQSGRTIAEGLSPQRLPVAVARQEALIALRELAVRSGLDTRIVLPGEARQGPPSVASDDVHRAGTRLTVQVRAFQHRHLVVFNLAGDGTVQLLYPIARMRDPAELPVGADYEFRADVKAPFGADHVVAIAGARPLSGLVQRLAELDGKAEPLAALEAARLSLSGMAYQLGIQGIFTRA